MTCWCWYCKDKKPQFITLDGQIICYGCGGTAIKFRGELGE